MPEPPMVMHDAMSKNLQQSVLLPEKEYLRTHQLYTPFVDVRLCNSSSVVTHPMSETKYESTMKPASYPLSAADEAMVDLDGAKMSPLM